MTTKKYNNVADADPDEFAPKTHAELEQRIALLEKVAEAAAIYIQHDSLRPSEAHRSAVNALRAAGYLEEGK